MSTKSNLAGLMMSGLAAVNTAANVLAAGAAASSRRIPAVIRIPGQVFAHLDAASIAYM